MRHPHLKNINERILVNLDIAGAMKAGADNIDEAYLKVKEGNERLFKRINALSRWRCYFAEEDRAFRDLHRGMIGIYKTYSAIGMEKDAYINWLMFYRDMDVLCSCLELCLQEYENISRGGTQSGSKRRVHRLRILKDWRINIQALNQYTRLVQNINYQTYQSPIYEIQTQIDTEKTMIAYRQAMMSYMDSYIASKEMENEGVIPSIPIIYPDLAKDRVEVIAPFSNQKKSGDKVVWREIMCTVPSFEYFGRLYDLLPWMIHESSHHLRVSSRKERNFFFAKYVFSYVYRVIIENELPVLANDSLYKTVGKVEWHLIDSMVDITLEDFKTRVDPGSGHLFENLGFEQVIEEIEAYLSVLFGGNASLAGKEAQYNIKETRETVYHFLLSEYRKEGILNEKNFRALAQFKQAKNHDEGDNLIEPLLICYYQQVKRMAGETLEEKGLAIEDIKCSQEWFERNIQEKSRSLENAGIGRDAVKEYHFSVTRLYQILNACVAVSRGGGEESVNIRDYLERVYRHYHKEEQKDGWREKEALLMNPRTMHVLRSLGLLNWEEEQFCSKMQEVFCKNDYKEMIRHMELKTKVYREAFADLLMVTTLDINSFGYCRQVLQTISDARMEESAYGEDDINNQRFQIVVSILLEEELRRESETNRSKILRDEEIGRIKLDGRGIIEEGVVYCEYTLKCITGKLLEMPEVAKDKKKQNEVFYFIGAVFEQLKCFLQGVRYEDVYNCTLLYVLLHGKKKANPAIVTLWEQCHYDEIERLCPPIKYIFWRLEYFCLGLKYIMPDGSVIVPLDIFDHMKRIRRSIVNEDKRGCKWENDWECLVTPKMDVGEFYNDPRLVFEKLSSQKLENTIAFIQNYYYYNRFRMMEEESHYGTGE
ncbi:MAG: hypothetical protein NC427_06845 [Ruminococcus flavefaciens]|nr:hypothetical protein [Ruminococcus flavefaciens]